VLFGFSFGEFTKWLGMERSNYALVIAQVTVFSPLSMVYFYFRSKQLNRDIEDCATELGANEMDRMGLVWGQLQRNIAGCLIVTFILSWDEYIISWFLSGFEKPYSVYIKNSMESTFDPQIYAIGTLVALITFCLLALVVGLNKKDLSWRA
jgi:spermidine/putrescine transport system permease protein